MTELEENGQEATGTGGPGPHNSLEKGPKAVVYITCGLLIAALVVVMTWGTWTRLSEWFGSPNNDGGKSDVSEDYDIKRYEQGKEAAVYMAEGDSKMDEARSIYNKLDQAETALVAKLVNGQPVDMEESIAWVKTLEGKAQASLDEAGRYYDRIMDMRLVKDYQGYARMQKDAINLYNELFAAQDAFLDGLTAAADSGRTFDAATMLDREQLQAITEIARDIDTANEYARVFQLDKDL